MRFHEYITHSAEETIALGGELAPVLKNARMVILRGDLEPERPRWSKASPKGFMLHRATISPVPRSP